MNWKDEKIKNQIKDMQKVYIECELMNYHYHIYLRNKYSEMARDLENQYAQELDNPRTGGSIIKMQEKNNNVKSPWQIDLGNRIDCMNLKKELEEQHLKQVDTWINGIQLSKEQLSALKQYVMINQCENAQAVADDTGFTVENVWKIRERTINKIYSEYFRKKCTVTDMSSVIS